MKASFKIFRIGLLIVTPFALLGAVMTHVDPFRLSNYRPFVVTRGVISESILAPGQIWYHHAAFIKPPINGRVEKLLVHVGDQIHKGQALMEITSNEGAELLDVARARRSPDLAEMRQVFAPVPVLSYFSGLLFEVRVSQGSSFTHHDDLFVIADELVAEVQVEEKNIGQIYVGQHVDVAIHSLPDLKLSAKVAEIPQEPYEPIAGEVLYNVTLKAALPQEARIGMPTLNTIEVGRQEAVLSVPTAAVQYENRQAYVLVSAFAWSSQRRAVRLGVSNGENVEVVTGLKEGDVVLVPLSSPAEPDLRKDLLETLDGDPVLAERTEHFIKPALMSAESKKKTSKEKKARRSAAGRAMSRLGDRS